MANPVLVIGNGKWATKENNLMAYTPYVGFNNNTVNYLPNELIFTRNTSSMNINSQQFIEQIPYNRLTYSEIFTDTIWQKVNATVSANTITNPVNGLLTATKFVEDTVNSTHQLQELNNINYKNEKVIFSFYAKAGERKIIQLFESVTSFASTLFDLTGGTVINNAGFSSTSITPVSNGWYRCTATINSLNGVGRMTFRIVTTGNFNSYLGDGVSGLYIYGAQSERSSSVRNYQIVRNRLSHPKIDFSLSGNPMYLVEPQRTNLIVNSISTIGNTNQDITSSATTNSNVVSGYLSYNLFDNTNNNAHFLFYVGSLTSGLTYTGTIFIKKAAHSWVQIAMSNAGFAGNPWTNFNFDTGLFGNQNTAGPITKQQLSNGWWKLTLTNTAIATISGVNTIGIFSTNNVNVVTRADGVPFSGTGANFVEIGGAQFELGVNSTSHIPTTGATSTRNGETSYLDMQNLGLFNQDNFTLYAEGINLSNSTNALTISINETTGLGGNTYYLGLYDGMRGITSDNGSLQLQGSSLSANTNFKICIIRNGTTVKYFRNGTQMGTTITVPVFNYRYITVNNGNGNTYTLKTLSLYAETLSDGECISMTT